MAKDVALDRLLRQEARERREAARKPLRPASYWQRHKLERCDCSGYWFPHRRGGGACEASPRADYYLALRHGATEAEAQALLSADQLERMYPVSE